MKKILMGMLVLSSIAFGCELTIEHHSLNFQSDTTAFETAKEDYAKGKMDKPIFDYITKKFVKDTIDLQEHLLNEHKEELSTFATVGIMKLRDKYTKLYEDMEKKSK